MGVFFYFQRIWGEADATLHLGWLPLVSLIVFMAAYSCGLSNVPFIVMGEVFPTRYRTFLGTISLLLSIWLSLWLSYDSFPTCWPDLEKILLSLFLLVALWHASFSFISFYRKLKAEHWRTWNNFSVAKFPKQRKTFHQQRWRMKKYYRLSARSSLPSLMDNADWSIIISCHRLMNWTIELILSEHFNYKISIDFSAFFFFWYRCCITFLTAIWQFIVIRQTRFITYFVILAKELCYNT